MTPYCAYCNFFSFSDADQPGPFSTVEYYVVEGPFSDYVAFENPLEGHLVLTKSLDYEAMRSISLQIEARDQGVPPMTSRALVTINVIDADDQNPAFLYERYDALLPPPGLVQEKESDQGYKLFDYLNATCISFEQVVIFYTFFLF